jgi:hypothetical protein
MPRLRRSRATDHCVEALLGFGALALFGLFLLSMELGLHRNSTGFWVLSLGAGGAYLSMAFAWFSGREQDGVPSDAGDTTTGSIQRPSGRTPES